MVARKGGLLYSEGVGKPRHSEFQRPISSKATWRSGYAPVCKTGYAGSIPAVASSRLSSAELRPRRAASPILRRFEKGQAGPGIIAKLKVANLARRRSFVYALSVTACRASFPGSSVVEQPAVNRLVAGSNPARGAKSQFLPNWACCRTQLAWRWPSFLPTGQMVVANQQATPRPSRCSSKPQN